MERLGGQDRGGTPQARGLRGRVPFSRNPHPPPNPYRKLGPLAPCTSTAWRSLPSKAKQALKGPCRVSYSVPWASRVSLWARRGLCGRQDTANSSLPLLLITISHRAGLSWAIAQCVLRSQDPGALCFTPFYANTQFLDGKAGLERGQGLPLLTQECYHVTGVQCLKGSGQESLFQKT